MSEPLTVFDRKAFRALALDTPNVTNDGRAKRLAEIVLLLLDDDERIAREFVEPVHEDFPP